MTSRSDTPRAAPLARANAFPPRLAFLYLLEAVCGIGANILMLGVFFYAHDVYHWQARQNLLLATAQGAIYAVSALMVPRLATRMGRSNGMLFVWGVAAGVLAIAVAVPKEAVQLAAVLVYTACGAASWPMVESLVSAGAEPETLSWRIAVYNLVWSGVGAITVCLCGRLIESWPAGMFIVPLSVHALACAVLLIKNLEPPAVLEQPAAPDESIASAKELSAAHRWGAAHAPAAAPRLLRLRSLALWLSRLALPATYAVVYSLSAIMPTLPVIRGLTPAWQTAFASVWMAARWLAFVLLGATSWWHTRPLALLAASAVMLLAFLGIVLRPCDLHLGIAPNPLLDGVLMVCCQMALGLCLGMIYAGSLYFGMVLSEGSTEHGGYHESLIGLGSVLGPGAGWIAGWAFPGDATAVVIAIAGVLFASVAASAAVSLAVTLKAKRDAAGSPGGAAPV